MSYKEEVLVIEQRTEKVLCSIGEWRAVATPGKAFKFSIGSTNWEEVAIPIPAEERDKEFELLEGCVALEW